MCERILNKLKTLVWWLYVGWQVRDIVADQTKEWTDMVMRQMAEEHELLRTHISQLSDLLKELMEDAQDLQLKELELRQERYDSKTW